MTKLKDEFLIPLKSAFESSSIKKRRGGKITDWDHLIFGVNRCLTYFDSGRDFVQKVMDTCLDSKIKVSSYFNCQRSSRRLSQVKEVNNALIKSYIAPIGSDPFAELACLDNYAIYAADGHYHKHASHDKHENGKNYPVGHIFTINLRIQTVNHIDVTRPLDKKEHEIKTLKRIGAKALRMEEPKGRKVIQVYDRAIIDFRQWYKWKKGSGIYILTREKKNMRLYCVAILDFDKNDPINAGVISDEQVGNSQGTIIRKVKYYDSISGEIFSFITNVFDVPPGVIAFLYKKRWDVEKVYDTFKNYYHENKAWGKTNEAKCQQALFLCLTHNLTLILESRLNVEENIKDEKIIRKQEQRRAKVIKKIIDAGRPLNSLAVKAYKSVQRSKQFLRCFNNMIGEDSSWLAFIELVRPRMEKYL